MKYLGADLQKDKYSLCGGKELNGFELWRNLEKHYGGAGKEVEVGGLSRFMSFPKCESESHLLRHLATWEEYLQKFGTQLRQTPQALRVMILDTLPNPYAEKLRPKRDKYPTYQSILKYCRDKIDEKRELLKAEVLNKPKKKISALVHEIMEMDQQAPPQPADAARRPRKPVPSNLLTNPITTVDQLREMVNAVGGPRQRAQGQEWDPAQELFQEVRL